MTDKPFIGYDDIEREKVLQKVGGYLKDKEKNIFFDNAEYIENLQYLTINMKREILQESDIVRVALSLKFSTVKLFESFLDGLSSNIREEVVHVLRGQYKIGEVTDHLDKFCTYLRKKDKLGEIVMCKDSSGKFV